MIRGGLLRGGLLVNALLALGVVDLPPPRREQEIDLAAAAAERAMANLSAVGIDVHKVLEFAGGPEWLVAAAELCLANRAMLAEHGRSDVIDAAVLLGRDGGYIDPPTLVRLMSGRLALRPPARDEKRDRTMEQLVERSLHPRGYCTCGACGTCDWCVATGKLEAEEAAAAERHREVCQARRMRRGEQKAVRKTKARKTAGRGW